MFVKLDKNSAPAEWPVEQQRIRFDNKGVSFPRDMSKVNVREYGFAPFLRSDPASYDPVFQEARELPPVEVNGIFVQQWEIVEKYTAEEKSAIIAENALRAEAEARSMAREQRNALLAETDWMALSDVTMSAEMAAYRQALRDITAQEGFPHSVNWPVKP